jgi:hypothetical protein
MTSSLLTRRKRKKATSGVMNPRMSEAIRGFHMSDGEVAESAFPPLTPIARSRNDDRTG